MDWRSALVGWLLGMCFGRWFSHRKAVAHARATALSEASALSLSSARAGHVIITGGRDALGHAGNDYDYRGDYDHSGAYDHDSALRGGWTPYELPNRGSDGVVPGVVRVVPADRASVCNGSPRTLNTYSGRFRGIDVDQADEHDAD